ncbi:SprT-like family-domain-containing protein [Paraphysoderma sedebokerense]|nr:SprT-like family-domain-containing protein [Paraphysoderma sedebokerense]
MTPSGHSPSHPLSYSFPSDKNNVLCEASAEKAKGMSQGLRYRPEWKENEEEDPYSLDLDLAKKLQEEENAIASRSQLDDAMRREDEELARRLATEEEMQFCIMSASSSSTTDYAEFDLHSLFLHYNDLYFGGKLSGCEVRWSSKMTLCAGQCHYHRASGYCSIRLSEPLLKFRPTSDSVNTLLHEMIHAFLFVTDGNDDHDGHGPNFQMHMARINQKAGTTITIYHNFHDEVDHYRTHIWKCDGPCSNRPPYFGIVKRSMNRPPQPADSWYQRHVETW